MNVNLLKRVSLILVMIPLVMYMLWVPSNTVSYAKSDKNKSTKAEKRLKKDVTSGFKDAQINIEKKHIKIQKVTSDNIEADVAGTIIERYIVTVKDDDTTFLNDSYEASQIMSAYVNSARSFYKHSKKYSLEIIYKRKANDGKGHLRYKKFSDVCMARDKFKTYDWDNMNGQYVSVTIDDYAVYWIQNLMSVNQKDYMYYL